MDKRNQYVMAITAATVTLGMIKIFGWAVDNGIEAFINAISHVSI